MLRFETNTIYLCHKILVINLCHEMKKVVNHWYVKRARTISIILALCVVGRLVQMRVTFELSTITSSTRFH